MLTDNILLDFKGTRSYSLCFPGIYLACLFFFFNYNDICCKCSHLLAHFICVSFCIKFHFVYISLNFKNYTLTFIFIIPKKDDEFFTAINIFNSNQDRKSVSLNKLERYILMMYSLHITINILKYY